MCFDGHITECMFVFNGGTSGGWCPRGFRQNMLLVQCVLQDVVPLLPLGVGERLVGVEAEVAASLRRQTGRPPFW